MKKQVRLSDPGPRCRAVPIPIQVDAANGGTLASTPTPSIMEIEKQMEAEVEKALKSCKPWDTKVKGFKQNTLHIRPRASESGPRRRRVYSTPAMPATHLEIPEIDVIKREDTSLLDTSAESLDEDARRPLYMNCPNTGKKLFKMEFNVRGYDQDNISVKVSAGRLIVHAVQREMVDGRKTTNEFCRKIKLPADVDSDQLKCMYMDNGILVIESPVIRNSISLNEFPSASMSTLLSNGNVSMSSSIIRQPMNTPVVKDCPESQSGKAIHIHAEVGRVFQSDDVIVKVRGHDKVIINAQKEDKSAKSKLSAQLTREFDLPERILPQTLKAGLTLDGVLKIVAHVEKKVSPTNGQNGSAPKVNGVDIPEAFV